MAGVAGRITLNWNGESWGWSSNITATDSNGNSITGSYGSDGWGVGATYTDGNGIFGTGSYGSNGWGVGVTYTDGNGTSATIGVSNDGLNGGITKTNGDFSGSIRGNVDFNGNWSIRGNATFPNANGDPVSAEGGISGGTGGTGASDLPSGSPPADNHSYPPTDNDGHDGSGGWDDFGDGWDFDGNDHAGLDDWDMDDWGPGGGGCADCDWNTGMVCDWVWGAGCGDGNCMC